jgi:Domain of unknown function (DUF1906)
MHRPSIVLPALSLSTLALLFVLAGHTDSDQAKPSSYLGFDLNEYPGDDALPALRKTFSFTSYWLSPPPQEKHNNWLGKRALLQSKGFGFVVLYNGRLSKNLKSEADAQQKGVVDAENASKLARQEGFSNKTIIFLDIEEGGRLSLSYHNYVHAWIDTLVKSNLRAGAYCSGIPINEGGGHSITTVADLQEHLGGRKLALWVFNDVCPPAPGCVVSQNPPPVAQGGFPEAVVWQFAQSPRRKERTAQCAATYSSDGNCYAPVDTDHKWPLDLNVANSPNPSRPRE